MTRPTEFVPEGRVLRETSTVGGTVVGPGSGGSGGGPADEVPISNGDGTATWRTITAAIVSYDNAVSGLVADDVQAAIDELVAGVGGGGVIVKEIDGSPSVAATELDVPNGSLVVAGSVATLKYVTPEGGGLETIKAHGNTGSTETFDLVDGNVHTATLNANCTFTFAAVTSGKACSFSMLLTQDATGSRLATWPGSVVWPGGTAPVLSTAPAAVDVLTFFTLDGGTTWYGFPTGGSGAAFATPAIVLGTAAAAGAASTVIRSDSTIVAFDATTPVTQAFGDVAATGSVAKAARRDHVHGMPAAPTTGGGHILLADGRATPFAFTDLLQMEDGSDFLWTDS